jgi:hypothetical protein
MSARKGFALDEARRTGEEIGIDWSRVTFDVEQFRQGMEVKLEHGLHDDATNVTGDDPIATAKIALAHLNEFPDYYIRLRRMEDEAEHGGRAGVREGTIVADSREGATVTDENETTTVELKRSESGMLLRLIVERRNNSVDPEDPVLPAAPLAVVGEKLLAALAKMDDPNAEPGTDFPHPR